MVKDIYAMMPDTSKTTAMTSIAPFSTMQSKSATQPSFNLASVLFSAFHNDNFYSMREEDRVRIHYHVLPEREVGVAIPIIIKASSIEIIIDIKVEEDFIQIVAILDPEVVEDRFKSLIEFQILEDAKAH